MAQRITSYSTLSADFGSGLSDDPSSGTGVVNDVLLLYNSFGQLVADYQEHTGAVNVASTPSVQYQYADGSSGQIRPTAVVYPNGRVLSYGYNSGTDDAVNRVSFLADVGGSSAGVHLAAYSYLGLNGFVQADHADPQNRFDLAMGTGADPYTGLDQFDRVVDLRWYNYGTSADAVRIQHGYDRAGNRLWRQDPVAAANSQPFDELYAYDGMYRLTALSRGTLNSGQTAIQTGTQNFAEQWTLDATGNWAEYREDTNGDGTWELDQTRAFEPANEITQIGGSSSLVGYDRAGNMTTMPQPGNWSASYSLTFDAWNRLVEIADGQTTVATYGYDARNFRALRTTGGATIQFYYSANWQVLEERSPIPNPQSVITATQNVWGLRYVDDLVLRDRNAESAPNSGNLGLTGSSLDERLYALQDP
jgi:hypothetical protein